jgi:hypothetical protein
MSEHEWTLRLADIPEHQTISLVTSIGEEPDLQDESSDEEPRPLLRCARPVSTDPPQPPESLNGWLGRDWQDCRSLPSPIESINRVRDGDSVVERFDSVKLRVDALASYRPSWNLWAENEKIARAAGDTFERLYSLYGKLQRDGERVELVIADGILSWTRAGGGVRHPLLMRPVRLEFDSQLPEFRIMETGEGTEFYSSLFRSMSDVDGRATGTLAEEVTALDLHPLGGSEVVGFLKSVATRLSSKGTYVEDGPPGPEREHPNIGRGPAFLLRKRTAGFARAIDAVIADLIAGGEIPRALCNVVGIALGDDAENIALAESSASSTVEELTDDAERQAILERLGWTFVRIRGTRFYRDPEAAMQPLFDRLIGMGIEPHANREWVAPINGDALASRVRARAIEIEGELSDQTVILATPARKSWRTTRRTSAVIVSE